MHSSMERSAGASFGGRDGGFWGGSGWQFMKTWGFLRKTSASARDPGKTGVRSRGLRVACGWPQQAKKDAVRLATGVRVLDAGGAQKGMNIDGFLNGKLFAI